MKMKVMFLKENNEIVEKNHQSTHQQKSNQLKMINNKDLCVLYYYKNNYSKILIYLQFKVTFL